MIDIISAASMVEEFLTSLRPIRRGDPWVIVKDHTEDYGFAWVFYWMPRSLLNRENPPITGNYPIIVQKDDGQMFRCVGPYHPKVYVDILRSRPEEMSERRITTPSKSVTIQKENEE